MNGFHANGDDDDQMPPPPPPGFFPPPPPPSVLAPPPSDDLPPPPPPPPTAESLPGPPPSSDLPQPPSTELASIVTDAYIPPPMAWVAAARTRKNRGPVPKKEPKPRPPTIDELLEAKRKSKLMIREKPERTQPGSTDQKPLGRFIRVAELRRGLGPTSTATKASGESTTDTTKAPNMDADIPTEPAAMREQTHDNPRKRKLSEMPAEEEAIISFAGNVADFHTDPEYEQIKLRYMGKDPFVSTFIADKRRKRQAEKKFNFDWNLDDDTTQSLNPIYQYFKEPTIMHGVRRGGFTDMNSRESEQQYAEMLRRADVQTGEQRAAAYLERAERNRQAARRFELSKHWREKSLDEMTERDWRILKDDFNIGVRGGVKVPNPIRYWSESHLSPDIMKVIEQVDYKEPTPVQRACIPIALQQRDLIGVAMTGSGKTAAFLLPLLVYIKDLPPVNKLNYDLGPYAVILAPTRELAQQIEQEANKFARPLGYKCMSLVGGHAMEEQSYKLQEGAEIIIATPGRLVDCIDRRVLVLSQCCYVIMDEADRMIDMGFEDQVNKILAALPVQNEKPEDGSTDPSKLRSTSTLIHGRELYRQTMMYTATMPPAVERIARNYLRKPAIINIGNVGEAVDTVEQRVEFVGGEDKRMRRIGDILQSGEFTPPVIVFVNAKAFCEAVARDIKKMGYKVATLHGSKTQEQREQALNELRTGKAEVLVATDLAGRGLDVNDVSLVIQYNMAPSIEAYTHRIGRTGRAGKTGVAITFLGSEDNDVLFDLKQMIANSPVSKVPEELKKHEAAVNKFGKGRGREVIE